MSEKTDVNYPDSGKNVGGLAEGEDGPFVSVGRAATLLGGLHKRTIYRMLDTKTLEGVYIGRRRLVVYGSLMNYADHLITQARESEHQAA